MNHLSTMVKDYTLTLEKASEDFMRNREMTMFRKETTSGYTLMLVGLSIELHEVTGNGTNTKQLRMSDAVTELASGGWQRNQLV